MYTKHGLYIPTDPSKPARLVDVEIGTKPEWRNLLDLMGGDCIGVSAYSDVEFWIDDEGRITKQPINVRANYWILRDSYDVLCVDNRGGGLVVNSPGQQVMNNIHSVFNKNGPGLLISGGTGNGGLTLSDYHSDRNDQDGICITAAGKQHITIVGAELRRDGANGESGGMAGLA